jgi:hypothetical protein
VIERGNERRRRLYLYYEIASLITNTLHMRKKISISVFGLIVSFSFLNAQVKPADSLHNLLVAHTQEDTVRVNLLNNLAYEVRRAKPAITDSLVKLAIELADKLIMQGKGYALAIEGARYYAKLSIRKATAYLPYQQLWKVEMIHKDPGLHVKDLGKYENG